MQKIFNFSVLFFKEIWIKTKSISKRTEYPIKKIASDINKNVRLVLPALHFPTGSNMTSKVGTKKAALRSKADKYLQNICLGKNTCVNKFYM